MSILIKQVLLENKIVDILIKNNKIEQIEQNISTKSMDDVVIAEGKAILPAFYNMHTHASMVCLRGIGEDKNLFDWLQTDIWPREEKLDESDIYTASRMAILEMIKNGTVFFNDMYFHQPATIKAVDEMGIRALISPVAMDMFDPKITQEKMNTMPQFFETEIKTNRIIKGIACHAVYTVSETLLNFCSKLAKKQNSFIHIHLAETKKEVDDCIQKYGISPTKLLDKHNLLTPKTILAHCVWLSEDDRKIIQEKGCLIAHCPVSNLKLVSGQMPLDEYEKQNLKIALGTDGASSNNALSMFSEMKIAALSAKIKAQNPCAAKVENITKMATKNGAQFMNINAGEIKVGSIADFMLVDLKNTLTQPQKMINSHFVYSMDSSCITDVCCDGKFVMLDKKVQNENEILDKFNELCSKII